MISELKEVFSSAELVSTRVVWAVTSTVAPTVLASIMVTLMVEVCCSATGMARFSVLLPVAVKVRV